ncbi:hypothetical protein ES703_19776 [subsurface metagenome]
MRDAVHDGIAATAVDADKLVALKLDVALADGANQYFQQLRIDCLRHRAQVIFGFVRL